MIHARIERQRPVNVPSYIVPGLMSGSVRTLVRPVASIGPVRPGYGLWVREGIRISPSQHRKDTLYFTYAGEGQRSAVPWMPLVAKPYGGYRAPEHMPIQASRLTLLVEQVETMRLEQVVEADAITSGLSISEGGYAVMGHPFLVPFETHSDALGFLLNQQEPLTEDNPEVSVVRFRAVARNIERLMRNAR